MTSKNPHPVVVAIGTDGDNDGAVTYAVQEAERAGCGVHLVHAVHAVPTGPAQLVRGYEEIRALGMNALDAAVGRAAERVAGRVPLTSQLLYGPIVQSVVTSGADARLIVLQRRDVSLLARLVTAPVLSAVASRAHVPVVSVPAGWKSRGRNVVTVGVDEPGGGHSVLREGLRAAQERGAELRIVHAWWLGNGYDDIVVGQAGHDEWSIRARHEIEAMVEELRGEYPDVPVTIEVRHQGAAMALVEVSHRSDLIVVGRHDPLIPFGSHLGPVARGVLRASACPVLVVDPGTAH